MADGLERLPRDVADEEDLDVVLDRDKLGVVDARLALDILALDLELDGNRLEAELGLAGDQPGLVFLGIGDAVRPRLDALLLAALPAVRQDGHALAMALVVGDDDEASEANEDGLPVLVVELRLFRQARSTGRGRPGAMGLVPEDFEDLSTRLV